MQNAYICDMVLIIFSVMTNTTNPCLMVVPVLLVEEIGVAEENH
jgi:hypothetical protein